MRCPQCQFESFSLIAPCESCGFAGDAATLERLSNVQYLLDETVGWTTVPDAVLVSLRAKYGRIHRQLLTELGLRDPIPTLEEAVEMRQERGQYEALLAEINHWLTTGLVADDALARLMNNARAQIERLNDRLLDAPVATETFSNTQAQQQRLARLTFLRDVVQRLFDEKKISQTAVSKITAPYNEQIEALELELGLRETAVSPPEPQPSRMERLTARLPWVGQSESDEEKPPREPWTWERVTETLLSERTLQAILFLGALLLFAAGVSWVAWNWGAFTPIVQIGFLTAFTAGFFGLGTYVYRNLGLRGSGIALFGVASLLIPLDFYAFYLGGGFPAGSEPVIWLVGSLVCLVAYTVLAVLLQAQFFGYLIALALASLGMAGMNVVDVPQVWWQTAVSGSGFLLGVIGLFVLPRRAENRFTFLKPSFQRIGLLFVVSVMILGLGWRFFMGTPFLQTAAPLAVNYWLGGVVLTLAVRPLRLRGLAWAAALSFPVAVWFTEQATFAPSVSLGWYGLGWALLVPVYFGVGYWLAGDTDTENEVGDYVRVVLLVAGGLTAVSAILSFTDNQAASVTHPLLAVSTIGATRLWHERRWLWLTGLLLLSGTAAWQGARGATLPELALPWGLLSILFILAAVRVQHAPARYDAPLFGMGWVAALLAILPPAALNDRSLLVYALTSWIGVNLWLATLAASRRHLGLSLILTAPLLRRLQERAFHWAAALSFLPWLGLLWTNGRSTDWRLATGYVLMAWLLLGAAWLARRVRWQYGRSWATAAYIANLAGIVLAFGNYRPFWGGILLGAGAFFFALALGAKRRWQFVPAVLVFAYGWLMLATEPQMNLTIHGETIFNNGLILLLAAVGFGLWRLGWERGFLRPFIGMTVFLGGINALGNLAVLESSIRAEYVWLAISFLLLAVSAVLLAWQERSLLAAHASIWLGVFAGGLLVIQYSRGSGRSAALAALLAVALILGERGLRQLMLRPRNRWVLLARKAWRLYRGPLLFAGWTISLGTIFLALVRNIVFLNGGVTRETWSIIALTILVALYGASAYLFGKRRFVLFAAVLAFFPWTLLANLGFYIWEPPAELMPLGVSWAVLALLMLGVVWVLAERLKTTRWGVPLHLVALGIMVLGFLAALGWTITAFWASLLGLAFFGLCALLDRWFYRPEGWVYGRFLYPFLALLPFIAGAGFDLAVAEPTLTQFGLLTVVFALPALGLGRWVERKEPSYRWPLYALAYGTALVGMMLVQENQPVLIGVLLFNAALAAFSVWVFQEPLWWYPATLLLPSAGVYLLRELDLFSLQNVGWMMIALGGVYLFGAWALTRLEQARFGTPLLIMSAVFGVFGLVPSEDTTLGIVVGFGGAAVLFAVMAFWKRWPALLWWVCLLYAIAFLNSFDLYTIEDWWISLVIWLGLLPLLAFAVWLDQSWGKEKLPDGSDVPPFSWNNIYQWPYEIGQRFLRWWAFAPYVMLLVGTTVVINGTWLNGIFRATSQFSELRWNYYYPQELISVVLGTAVFFYVFYRFRIWVLLVASWFYLQVFWSMVIIAVGWWNSLTTGAYFFLPMTVLTAVIAILIEVGAFGVVGQRRAFALRRTARRHNWWMAWALYALLIFNIGIGQLMAFENENWTNVVVTVVHGLLIAVIGTVWRREWVVGIPQLFWFVALVQVADIWEWPISRSVPAYATLVLVYGAVGYLLLWRERVGHGRREKARLFPTFGTMLVWKRPFILGGWILSGLVLLIALGNGANVLALAIRFAVGSRFALASGEIVQTQMMVSTLAILGLFYLIAALAERRPRWGYGALFFLLVSWSLWLRLLGQQVELQYYAIPASIYLFGIGWFEWRTGSKTLATWIDRAALLLLFGSVFWQSLTSDNGAWYALLMIVEGLLVLWWGSARRLRRLLYAGVLGVVVALLGQLIRPLLAFNTVAMLILGLVLLVLGILLERQLENVRALSQDMRQRLEHWE